MFTLWGLSFAEFFFSFVFVFELFCKVRNVPLSFLRWLSKWKCYRVCLFSGEICVFVIRFGIGESLCLSIFLLFSSAFGIYVVFSKCLRTF